MPSSRSTARGPARRALIVEVARRRFTEVGYDATTIGDIADELGLSKAAIAYYFPTKDRFLDELLDPLLDELERAVTEAGREPRAALGAYLATLVGHRDLAVWMDTDPAIARHERFGSRLSAVNDRTIATITGRSRRTVDRVRAMAVLGGIWRPVREAAADDLAPHLDDIVEVALAGVDAPA